jgi:polyphosphate glucokinase
VTPEAVVKKVRDLVAFFDWNGPVGCAFPARVKKGIVTTASNIDDRFIGTNIARIIQDATTLPTRVVNDADAACIAEMSFGAGKGRNDLVILLTVGTGIGSGLFNCSTLIPNTEFGHLLVDGTTGEKHASDRTRQKKQLSWKAWARRFQEYLDRIEYLMAPDLIIIGGGISKESRKPLWFKHLSTKAELVTAELANDAGIVGAAFHARDLAPN